MLQLGHARHRRTVDRDDHVTGLDPGTGGRTGRLFDQQPGRHASLALLLGCQRTHGDAQPAARAIDRLRTGDALVLHFAQGDVDADRLAVANDLQAGGRAGLHQRDLGRQIGRIVDVLLADPGDHIAGLQAGACRRPILLDLADQSAVRRLQAEGVDQRLIQFLDADTEPSARDLAGLDQLLLDIRGDIDRNCERQALKAAGAAVDLRIDADDFALQIEQRTTRIARIDRHVGLQERHVGAFGEGTCLGADDAGGGAVFETVGRADRQHRVADAAGAGIAELDHRQIGRRNLQHRDIALLVGADHLGLEFAPVGQLDDDFLGAIDHMRIRQDRAVGADDEARAQGMRDGAVRAARCTRSREAAEELREGVARIGLGILVVGLVRQGNLAPLARDTDVDHGRSVALDDGGKIRDRPGHDDCWRRPGGHTGRCCRSYWIRAARKRGRHRRRCLGRSEMADPETGITANQRSQDSAGDGTTGEIFRIHHALHVG